MSDPEDVSVSGGSVTPRGVQHVLLETAESQNQSTFTVKFNNGGSEGIFRVKYDNEVEGRAVLLADPCRPHADSPPEKRKSVVAVSSPPPLDAQLAVPRQTSSDAPSPTGLEAESAAQAVATSTPGIAPVIMTPASRAPPVTAASPATASATVATDTAAKATEVSGDPATMGAVDVIADIGATVATEVAEATASKAAVAATAEAPSAGGYPVATQKTPALSQKLPPVAAACGVSPKALAASETQKQGPRFLLECVGAASGARQQLSCTASEPSTLRVGREVQSPEFWTKLVPHEASRAGISREHFEIRENADAPSGFSIVNLSRAGTVRNGVSVKTEDVLDFGDVITIGVDQSPETKELGWKLAAIQFQFVVPFDSMGCLGYDASSKPSCSVSLHCNHVAGRSATELAQMPESVKTLESRKDMAHTAALLRVGRSLQVPKWWERLLPDARLVTCISREHFQICLGNDGIPLLTNLSAAGTLVNGKFVRESCALALGDRIGIPSSKPDDEPLVEFEYCEINLATAGEQSLVSAATAVGTQELPSTPVLRASRAVNVSESSQNLFHIMQEAAALPTETDLPSVASLTSVSAVPFSFDCVSVRGQADEHMARLSDEVSRVLAPAAGQLSFRVGRLVQPMVFWELLIPDAAARNALSRECFEVTMTKDLEPAFSMRNLSGHGTMLNSNRVYAQAPLQHGDILGIGAAQVRSGASEVVPIVQLRFILGVTSRSQDISAFLPKDTGNIGNESPTASMENQRDGCGILRRSLSASSASTVVQGAAEIDEIAVSRDDIRIRGPCELGEADPLRLSHSALCPPIDELPKFGYGDDGEDKLTRSVGKMALGKLVEQESQMWALDSSVSSIERAINDHEMTPAEAQDQLVQLEGRLVRLQCHGVDSVDLRGLDSDSVMEANSLKQELTQKSEALQNRLERIFASLKS